MKLGVVYIVFDGIELLEHSIRQIRNHVDYIAVLYQTQSWFGDQLPKSDLLELNKLSSSKLIDDLILYQSFTPLKRKDFSSIRVAKSYETNKRQFGLNLCLRKKCTHFICMDSDEFYKTDQFKNAKDIIIKNNYELTSTRFINYVNIPVVHRGLDPLRVPFICKINSSSKLGSKFFVRCDPTRGVSGKYSNTHDFNTQVITMHHMETVRKNLKLKYSSTTRAVFKRDKINELILNINSIKESSKKFSFNKIIFPGTNIVSLNHCENIFKIPYDTW